MIIALGSLWLLTKECIQFPGSSHSLPYQPTYVPIPPAKMKEKYRVQNDPGLESLLLTVVLVWIRISGDCSFLLTHRLTAVTVPQKTESGIQAGKSSFHSISLLKARSRVGGEVLWEIAEVQLLRNVPIGVWHIGTGRNHRTA